MNKNNLKFGTYDLKATMSVSEIAEKLASGAASDNVFNLTVLPGETVAEIKQKLLKNGYSSEQINEAFEKTIRIKSSKAFMMKMVTSPFRPACSVHPEGYLFGDTYQFYKGESFEKVLNTMISALMDVVA